jgi:hypothetical protein
VDDVIVAGARAFDQIRRCSWDGEGDPNMQRQIEGSLEWLNRMDNVDWVPPAIKIMQTSSDAAKVMQLLAALERLAAFMLVHRANVNERIHRYAAVLDAIEKGAALDATSPLQLTADEQRQFVTALDGDVYLEPKIRVYVLLRLDQALGDASAKYDVDTRLAPDLGELAPGLPHDYPRAPKKGPRLRRARTPTGLTTEPPTLPFGPPILAAHRRFDSRRTLVTLAWRLRLSARSLDEPAHERI